MPKYGTLYIDGNSFFHKLDPSLKLMIFFLWSITVFLFLDIRISLILLCTGFAFLCLSQVPLRTIKILFSVVIIFNIINALFILLLTPEFGSVLIGKKTIAFSISNFIVTKETLFYVLTISLKYLSLLPMALILIFTTHPTKLAASLNKIGIPYKIAYSFNIIFRYIPNIQNEFKLITNAQAARGLSYGKDEKKIIKRIKNLFNIIVPLLNSSLNRIDNITNAMELREFGKYNRRTWYNRIIYTKRDLFTLIVAIIIFIIAVYIRVNASHWFWYPFK